MTGLSKKLHYALALVGSIGLIDAGILTYEHYTGGHLPCTVTHGCERVLTSKYAVISGVPLAALGILFYLSIIIVTLYSLTAKKDWLRDLLLLMGFSGFLASLGLVYLQGFVIHAWCQYCLLSALSSTLVFVLGLGLVLTYNKEDHEKSSSHH